MIKIVLLFLVSFSIQLGYCQFEEKLETEKFFSDFLKWRRTKSIMVFNEFQKFSKFDYDLMNERNTNFLNNNDTLWGFNNSLVWFHDVNNITVGKDYGKKEGFLLDSILKNEILKKITDTSNLIKPSEFKVDGVKFMDLNEIINEYKLNNTSSYFIFSKLIFFTNFNFCLVKVTRKDLSDNDFFFYSFMLYEKLKEEWRQKIEFTIYLKMKPKEY